MINDWDENRCSERDYDDYAEDEISEHRLELEKEGMIEMLVGIVPEHRQKEIACSCSMPELKDAINAFERWNRGRRKCRECAATFITDHIHGDYS